MKIKIDISGHLPKRDAVSPKISVKKIPYLKPLKLESQQNRNARNIRFDLTGHTSKLSMGKSLELIDTRLVQQTPNKQLRAI